MTWKDEIKKQWNENPVQTMIAAGFVATAATKLIDVVSSVQGRRAYAKSVNYRVKHKK